MTRPIKFRAWDKEIKHMQSWEYMMTLEMWTVFENFTQKRKNWELMQFTGLTDKNGKEIYEGDIVESANLKWLVIWDEEEAGFRLKNEPSMRQFIFPIHCEVIGNIYENPELLKTNLYKV